MNGTVEIGRRPGMRARSIVYLIRSAVWGASMLLIGLAGYGRSTLGQLILAAHVIVIAIALRDLRYQRLPRPAWGVLDVVMPGILGIVAGADPSWFHLVIAAQAAGGFLAPRRRYALIIGGAALATIVVSQLMETASVLIPLSSHGIEIIHYGAIGLGVGMGTGILVIMGRRVWITRERLAVAAEADRRTVETQRRFLSMVSHELRTPLTSIQGFAEVLGDRSRFTEGEVDEFTDAIRSQAAHLARLVDDVLVVLRAEAGRLDIKIAPVEIANVLARIEATGIVRAPKVLRARIEGEVWAAADEDRLFQVVRNLVENAVKYGGDHIEVSVTTRAGRVRLLVSDDGPGIPPDRIELAFSEFGQVEEPASRSSSGFGLGLPIVRSLLEAMGGGVTYRPPGSGPGGFVVDLPRAQPPTPAPVLAQHTAAD